MAAKVSSGQPILILREGTERSRGREAQKRNIQVAKLLSEILRTSLGPRGMDKMLVDSFGDVTITNDGAAMLKEMDIEHPAAKMMVEIAKTVDNEVGDGTTSVVVLAGALLEEAEELIKKDVHPTVIINGYKQAASKALETYKEIAVKVDSLDKDWLRKIAATSMGTKMVSREKNFLASIAVDAVLAVKEDMDGDYRVDIDEVKVETKPGKSIHDTMLVQGVVLDKEVAHSGMPKTMKDAKIALVNAPIEIEKTEFDARINISTPDQIKLFLDEENKMIQEMVEKITRTGANVFLCQKGIEDIAQQYLARKKVLAVRRVKSSDMDKLSRATGARIVTNIDDLSEKDLGKAGLVAERKIEEDKWVFIEGCENPRSVTVVIRGATERVVDEIERSLHDALSVVKDVVMRPMIVAGGGAPELEAASRVRSWAEKLSGREQLAATRFANALETIPLTLAENAGLDTVDMEPELRAEHKAGKVWVGIDAISGTKADMMEKEVVEPLVVKEQIVKSATEVASMILRIDDIIASSKMKAPPGSPPEEGMGEEY